MQGGRQGISPNTTAGKPKKHLRWRSLPEVKSYELRGWTWQELGLSLRVFTRNLVLEFSAGRSLRNLRPWTSTKLPKEVCGRPMVGQRLSLLRHTGQESSARGRHPTRSSWISIPSANIAARVSHIQIKSTSTTHDRIPWACHLATPRRGLHYQRVRRLVRSCHCVAGVCQLMGNASR